MQKYKLTIEYNGAAYSGWQVQLNSYVTIQGKLEEAARKIFKQDIKLLGSGRTDAGVHAAGQIAHCRIDTPYSNDKIKNAFNGNLPDDIVVLKVEKVKDSFHAQYSAKGKTYRYQIINRADRPALLRNFCLHYPYKLNMPLMRKEAKVLVGRHDFKSFACVDSSDKDKDTVRTIKRLVIRKSGELITIEIEANGFLYKMVRNIVSTLLKVGSGKLEKGSVKRILAQKSRLGAVEPVQPYGLTLLKVRY